MLSDIQKSIQIRAIRNRADYAHTCSSLFNQDQDNPCITHFTCSLIIIIEWLRTCNLMWVINTKMFNNEPNSLNTHIATNMKMINKEPSWFCPHRAVNHSKIRIFYEVHTVLVVSKSSWSYWPLVVWYTEINTNTFNKEPSWLCT